METSMVFPRVTRMTTLTVVLCGMVVSVLAGRAETVEQAPGEPPKFENPVLIRFEGVIMPLLEQFLYRKLNQAQQDNADLIIIEIESPGGDAAVSFQIAQTLRDVDWAQTVAFVPKMALSGAAIVALGCDRIVMNPDAVLGDAGPIAMGPDRAFRFVPAKIQSDLARQIRDLATAAGRPEALAEAMIDKNVVVYEVEHHETG